jgi:hypothetical protein
VIEDPNNGALNVKFSVALRLHDPHLASQHVAFAERLAVVNPRSEDWVRDRGREEIVAFTESPLVVLGEGCRGNRDHRLKLLVE